MMGMDNDGSGNGPFVKRTLTYSIMVMVLLTSAITIFGDTPPTNNGYESELNELLGGYYDMTGSTTTTEEIWGLTGIYTPIGIDAQGNNSSARMVLNDGWIAGDRVTSYTPTQYNGASSLGQGIFGHTVQYDKDKKLYYYTDHESGLLDITDGTASKPSDGTLYTNVVMDTKHKSNIFFTVGNKQQEENGTFWYNFSGYRYCFQPLKDYHYNTSTPITHTDTSLSLIWYTYTTDSGISGQLVVGSDSGVSYITATQIVQAYNSANYTAKFQMAFNGINMNLYIKMDVYALTQGGYSIEQCYTAGLWSIMVTSPATVVDSSSSSSPFTLNKFVDVATKLLTFQIADYGLTGITGTIASTVFTMSMLTSMIALGLCGLWPLMILAAVVVAVTSFFGISIPLP